MYECNFFIYTLFSLIFIIEIVCVFLDFTNKKKLYVEGF